MTNPQGESTNALYGFIRSVFKIIKDFSPEHIVAVFDGPDNKKSRSAIFSDYKGHRKAMPEDLYPQIERALYFCQIAGIPVLQVPGVEADDTMGSIAKWAEKLGSKAYLCSSDKDLCQLVTDHVFVIHPHKDNLLVDPEKVQELFGVRPDQMIDYLAMVGDASDNIPGLEGFGPKTVSALLKEHNSLDFLLDHPEKLSGKKRDTILAQRDVALMSKKLATIQLDVDFPHSEDFFLYKEPQLSEVKEFYQNMHFLSLLKEMDGLGPNTSKQPQIDQSLLYHLVNSQAEMASLEEALSKEAEICFDLETTSLNAMKAEIVGIGLGFKESEAFYVPFNGNIPKSEILLFLQKLFCSEHQSFYGHNIKYDLHVLLNEGISLPKISFDTMVASYVLNPHTPKHNLDQLSLERFGKTKTSIEDLIGKGKKQISMLDVPLEKVGQYCCEDVVYSTRLKKLFTEELRQKSLESVFYEIEIPLIPVLLTMERNGIFINNSLLLSMSEALTKKINNVETAIYEMAGEKFNLNSPKQLSTLLFEKLLLKPPKKTQTGYSTSAEVLESLSDESPIVHKIIAYRGLEKLRSTYVDALPGFIHPKTHRIHCTFNQSVTATGRLSCQDPNLQNIPVRSEEGKKIREAFIPQNKSYQFLSADYSQIELRLLAHLSKDPSLIEAFEKGQDIHTFTASLVFGVPIDMVTSEMRYQAKAVNFGILYGQQAFGLSQELSIDFKKASEFIKTYFARYPQVKHYLDECKTYAKNYGFATTITGRKRPIPEINNKNPMIRAAAERLAINTPLQGTAADLIKIAMIKIQKMLEDSHLRAQMILQIHDELLFEVHCDDTEILSKNVKKIMESVFHLSVPLVVDISIGKNWGDC